VSSGIRDVIRFLIQHHMVNTPTLHRVYPYNNLSSRSMPSRIETFFPVH
jgi:hypothetical protein